MSKKSSSKNKKSKKPEVGDSVFLIGEKKHIKMFFRKKEMRNGEEWAYCTWIIPNIHDSNLDQCNFNWFPVRLLTLDRPPTPTDMYSFPGF